MAHHIIKANNANAAEATGTSQTLRNTIAESTNEHECDRPSAVWLLREMWWSLAYQARWRTDTDARSDSRISPQLSAFALSEVVLTTCSFSKFACYKLTSVLLHSCSQCSYRTLRIFLFWDGKSQRTCYILHLSQWCKANQNHLAILHHIWTYRYVGTAPKR